MNYQTIQTATIDEATVSQVRDAVDKANRRATRIGTTGYTFSYEPTDPRPVCVDDPFNPGCQKVVGYVAQVVATVTGEAPRYQGWTFVATLIWDGDEPVIRKIPGLEVDTTPARTHLTPRGCDHCNTARDRNDTYLLVSDQGEFKQVGSNCLADFLGVQVNLSMIGWNPYEGCDSTNRYAPEFLLSLDILELAITATRVWGWVPATTYDKIPTKSRIQDVLWGVPKIKAEYQELLAEEHRPEDTAQAALVLEWVRTNGDTGEYLTNLRVALADNTFNARNLGLVASAPASFARSQERETERKVEREAQAASEWIGTPKERLRNLRLTVTGVRYLDSDWGTTTLVMFKDEAGNNVKWFASNAPEAVQVVGAVVLLDGTVKEHDTYRDSKSTVLTICKIKEVVTS